MNTEQLTWSTSSHSGGEAGSCPVAPTTWSPFLTYAAA